jgi:hypothetical protein
MLAGFVVEMSQQQSSCENAKSLLLRCVEVDALFLICLLALLV